MDPDLPWHLRIGQIILSSGIPKVDPFSYTMPSYPLIDHQWLSNLFLAKASPLVGMVGLSAIFATMALITLLLILPLKKDKFATLILIISSASLLSPLGIRTQLISWLFLALVFKILLNQELFLRWKFFIPLIVLAWVNFHGSFAVGLVAILLILFVKRQAFTILMLSFAATLINPYGIKIYQEVFQHLSSLNLHLLINEWVPALLSLDPPFWLLLSLSLALMIRFYSRFSQEQKIIYFFFLAFSIFGQRNLPFWIISTIPILTQGLALLEKAASQNKLSQIRFNKFYLTLFYSNLVLSLVWAGVVLIEYSQFSESRFYPEEAIQFLKKQNLEGEIFSDYSWGGYLDLKLPQKKVFIDGRMTVWRWQPPNSRESSSALDEYIEIIQGKINFNQPAQKYHIKYVLWKSPWRALENQGWKKIYSDNLAVIYQRPDFR